MSTQPAKNFIFMSDDEIERAFRIYTILKPLVKYFWMSGDSLFKMRRDLDNYEGSNGEGLEFINFLTMYKETRGWKIMQGWERVK